MLDKNKVHKRKDTETNAVNGGVGGKNKSRIYFSFSVHSVRVPVALHDKEWSRFRLMACLQCSMKSAQMLCAEKMTLLTSSVSFLSTGETPGPYHYADTPTEPYHADENLSPLNLIKVLFLLFLATLPLLECFCIPQRADDFHLEGISCY